MTDNAQPMQIYLKSLAGDLYPFPAEANNIDLIRHLLAQQLSTPHTTIETNQIVIFDTDQPDDTVAPTLLAGQTYSFIVRNANTIRCIMQYEDPVHDPQTNTVYDKYTFKMVDLTSHTFLLNDIILYYSTDHDVFIPSRYFVETDIGFGRPAQPLIPNQTCYSMICDAVKDMLEVPWYDRYTVIDLVYDAWDNHLINNYEGDAFDTTPHVEEEPDWGQEFQLRQYQEAYGPYDHADE